MRFCGLFWVSIITNFWFFRIPKKPGRIWRASHGVSCYQVWPSPFSLSPSSASTWETQVQLWILLGWAGLASMIGFLFSLASFPLFFTWIHIPYSSQNKNQTHALSSASSSLLCSRPHGGVLTWWLCISHLLPVAPLSVSPFCVHSFPHQILPSTFSSLCLHLSYLFLSCSVWYTMAMTYTSQKFL